MRTMAAIAIGVSIGVALIGLVAADVVFLCGGLVAGAITWLYIRRSPPDRRVVLALAIGFAVFTILWLIAVVVALTAIPDGFNEAF